MTQVHTAISQETDSTRAGQALGSAMRQAFHGAAPDALVVFASAQHDYAALLGALADEAGTEVIVGASSAGEFITGERGEGRVSAMGIRSDSMRFAVGVGAASRGTCGRAARSAVQAFQGPGRSRCPTAARW